MSARGFAVGNIDITIICERPRISPHVEELKSRLAGWLECGVDRVNLKGKTHEKVDAIGEGRAIEVHAVILLRPITE